jgi:hypothetical protein
VDAGVAIVKINEVESMGGTPGDWVELTNIGTVTADLSGWVVSDNGTTNRFTIQAGTTLAPGAFVAIDVSGLGDNDMARLFDQSATLVDSYTWTVPEQNTTYGRCPDGTGAFVTTTASTKGAANACPPADAGSD